MVAGGKLILAEDLAAFRDELAIYFGTLNEFREGLTKTLPEKPEMLIVYEQCKAFNTLPFSGGIVDQPHIWMQYYKVCDEIVQVIAATEENANQQKQQKG